MLMDQDLQSGASTKDMRANFPETCRYVRYTKPNDAISYNPAGAMASANANSSTIFGVLDK